ncbi:hypothetical protein EYF80_022438 [Liparis tanakae]|uniref:Uncharacterized protein n=1 Tax=Liparis tanakae TaxID=230148 RepID=A0A4Z2HP34_9TELE|nr:hypothetical protein EYF80_022438 [Liparis tanakae]
MPLCAFTRRIFITRDYNLVSRNRTKEPRGHLPERMSAVWGSRGSRCVEPGGPSASLSHCCHTAVTLLSHCCHTAGYKNNFCYQRQKFRAKETCQLEGIVRLFQAEQKLFMGCAHGPR